MDVFTIIDVVNGVFWIAANALLAYSAAVLVAFLIGYFILFDPGATTAGKLIFRFMMSLVGVVLLSVIGVFIDPAPGRDWWNFPTGEVELWRPALRLAVYVGVAFTITGLAKLLIYRKWFPHRLKKASDIEIIKPRHTAEIPIVKNLDK